MVGVLLPQQVVKMMAEIESKVGNANSMYARLEKLAFAKMKGFNEKTGANSVGEIIHRLQVPAIHTVKDAERFIDDIGTIEKAIYEAARAEEINVTNEYGGILRKNTGITVMGPMHFQRMYTSLAPNPVKALNPITVNALRPLLGNWTATNHNINTWVKTEHDKLIPKIQELESAKGTFNENERKRLDDLRRDNEKLLDRYIKYEEEPRN